jgi:hypothetical protein
MTNCDFMAKAIMQPIAMYERAVEPTIRALPGGLKNRSRRADFTQPRV